MKLRSCRFGRILAAVCLLSSATAHAQVITEFSANITPGSQPLGIAAGSDGNLWFTEYAGKRIGRITTSGFVTEFSSNLTGNPFGITAGPDGNLWFPENTANRIGRITTSGAVTEFSAVGGALQYVTAGPDGNLWFTDESLSKIGRITPAGTVTLFSTGITSHASPIGIAAGPDCHLWFAENDTNQIGRITTLGQVTEFSVAGRPFAIASGPDGNLWFTENNPARIGRITPDGVVTEFAAGLTGIPRGIAAGPDGNLWFAADSAIGRITPLGVISMFSANLSPDSQVIGITAGPDGNMWFTEQFGDRIGRITTGIGPSFTAAPRISKSFGSPSIVLNDFSSLAFVINNPNTSATLTGVSITDPLPAGLAVSSPNGLAGSCGGGELVATPGTNTINLTGATLPPGGACTFTANVSATSTGTKINATAAVTSIEGGIGNTACAVIQVVSGNCTLDIDGDGTVDALTDGLLVMRALSGSTGSAATAQGVASGAARKTWAQIQPIIRSDPLDIDGNGVTDALTDGLMIMRAMFGLTGSAVTSGAIGPNATRGTWSLIRNYLNGNCGTNFAP